MTTTTKITVSQKGASYYLKAGNKPPVRLGTLRRLAEKIEDIEAEVGELLIACDDSALIAAIQHERDCMANDGVDGVPMTSDEADRAQGFIPVVEPVVAADAPMTCDGEPDPADFDAQCTLANAAAAPVVDFATLPEGVVAVPLDTTTPEDLHATVAEAVGEAPAAAESTDDAASEEVEPAAARDPRLPAPGTVITVEHKGTHGGRWEVTVEEFGFTFNGVHYRSLSGVAKAATGQNVNGFLWAGLVRRAAAGESKAKGPIKKAIRESQREVILLARAKAAQWLQANLDAGCTILGDGREADAAEAMRSLIAKMAG